MKKESELTDRISEVLELTKNSINSDLKFTELKINRLDTYKTLIFKAIRNFQKHCSSCELKENCDKIKCETYTNILILKDKLKEIENIKNKNLSEFKDYGSEQEAKPETAKQPEKIVLRRGRPKIKDYEMKIIAFDILETAINERIEKNYPVRSLSNYYTLLKYCKKYFNKNLSELTIEDIEQERAKLEKKSKNSNNKQ